MSSSVSLFALSLLALGQITAGLIVKSYDYSNFGADCNTDTEQYLQLEMYDFHDNPKVTMTWRQVTGECGAAVSNPAEWSETYDSSTGDLPPDSFGRVKLEVFVCAPFGEYELELNVESTSAADSTLQQRTSWEIEYGVNEFLIWDTVDTVLQSDTDYSPKVPGVYTWPFSGATGYYSKLYAGPLPPIQCPEHIPANTVYKGCYADRASSRTFKGGELSLPGRENPTGMTPQACSDFCAGYDYFGLEYSYECYCGTASEFAAATSSSNCGASYQFLCTGDSTATCGGHSAMSVYERTDSTPTPAPTPAPAPVSSGYTSEGCFVDTKSNRIMSGKVNQEPMSAEICYGICNDGVNNYFGTQFGKECWCGVDTDLTANGDEVDSSECDITCSGTSTGETCGGFDRMSAYKIGGATYVGCYTDMRSARAMPAAGKYISSTMTNEVCQDRCSGLGYAYAGTQYGNECWCDDSFIDHGEVDTCTSTCGGDSNQYCGGYFALDIYML